MRPVGGRRRPVIVGALRTPIGRGHPERGAFADLHPADLLGHVLGAVIERAGINAEEVDAVIAGCVQQFGEQGRNIARNAWLGEGLPAGTSATTVDVQCGSSQQAVGYAAALIAAGVHDVVVAGGVEHMGRITFADLADTEARYGSAIPDRAAERYDLVGQGIAAERLSRKYGVSREAMDAFALASHARAHRSTVGLAFDREIAPVVLADGVTVHHDQGIRTDTSLARLAALGPAFAEDGTVTAGNASQISDGAAAVLLMSEAKARWLGLAPRAEVVDQISVGCDPEVMLEGPIPATTALLRRQGMTVADVDRFEVNEAFAPVVLAWADVVGASLDRVNVRGGAIALGHPLGASGARLVTTLVHLLEDEDAELGLVTMCCAGGLGTATLLRRTS